VSYLALIRRGLYGWQVDTGEMPAEEVLRAFQNSMVRPTFSLRTAIRSHLLSTVAGGLLFLVGLLGLLLLIWQVFKRKQQRTTAPNT
jgi:hypothetical protein